MNKKDLKKQLDDLYFSYKKKFSSRDPVWNLHSLKDERDIEILGLITSSYSYGNVDQINRFISLLMNRTGNKFFEFTSNYSEHKDKKFLKGLYYRFNSENDLSLLFININKAIKRFGSLKELFKKDYQVYDENILNALKFFSEYLVKINTVGSGLRYLIPSPVNNSACKRMNLFLRWMIRKDEIDPGIWSNSFDKSKLIMPVDVHIYRIARELKLAKRKSGDLKFAIELTNSLKKFDPADPVKYDFALCHFQMER